MCGGARALHGAIARESRRERGGRWGGRGPDPERERRTAVRGPQLDRRWHQLVREDVYFGKVISVRQV